MPAGAVRGSRPEERFAGRYPAGRARRAPQSTAEESAVSATEITVIGNVVDSPRRVRLQHGSVTNFRLASTERRFDRETQSWVDAGTFWADVECWGDLGGHVSQSLSKGDPVVVVGTLTTRQWETENGRGSVSQIRAEAVGPNLTRGVAEFHRATRPAAAAAEPAAADVDEPGTEGPVDDHGALRAGEDYIADPATLHDVDPDAPVEPALTEAALH